MADSGVGRMSGVVPDPNITPPKYPKNPASLANVDGRPAAGIPADVPTIAQGITMISNCPVCGVGYAIQDLPTHMREEAIKNTVNPFDIDNGADGDDDDQRFMYAPAQNR